MDNYKITIQYDGTRYKGWQIQNGTPDTIQGKLTDILCKLTEEKIDIIGSGRTDAGVHALSQVANFHINLPKDMTEKDLLDYMNHYLPEDIAVTTIEKVDERFHARFSARQKTYRYRIHTGTASNVFERKYVYKYLDNKLDVNAMRAAAEKLIGEHDFLSFCGNRHFKKSSVRTIYNIAIMDNENEIVIDYTGNGFLQNMVRILTGTLIEVGAGIKSPDDISRIISSKNRDNAGFTAPAQGLILVNVEY